MIALRRLLALLVFLSTSFTLCAQDRSYGRSVVATQYGMVATSQVSASQAGALILERGGSAIDAAITANAVLDVHRTHFQWYGRRSLCHLLGGEDRQDLRPQDAAAGHRRLSPLSIAAKRASRRCPN